MRLGQKGHGWALDSPVSTYYPSLTFDQREQIKESNVECGSWNPLIIEGIQVVADERVGSAVLDVTMAMTRGCW